MRTKNRLWEQSTRNAPQKWLSRATIRNAMGLQDMSAGQIAAVDVDGDGQVTTSDALMIIRIAMGLIK